MQGYIKLHRQLLEWEWYKNIPVRVLFEHCLLKANFQNKNWQGIFIPKGSFITSYENLSIETGLTIQQIRTAISKLKLTGEITYKSTSHYSIITINNWELYQTDNTQNNIQTTNNQQANNKQVTTTKECKECKNEKNDKKFLLNTDPFLNPIKETFLNEFEKQTGKRPRLTYQECNKLIELSEEQTDFLELIPEAIKKLKEIDFKDINFKPSANWLLKDNNFVRVINDEFTQEEQKSPQQLFLERMRREREQTQ